MNTASITATPKSPYYFEFDIGGVSPGDTVYVVWCRYSVGDTFGSTEGLFDAMVCTDRASVPYLERELDRKRADYFGGVEETFVEEVKLES